MMILNSTSPDRAVARPTIRKACMDDIEAVASLFDQYRQFYEQPADSSLAHRFIQQRMTRAESVIFVAPGEARGSLIGFCQLYPSFCSVAAAPILVLYDLFVSPGARRSGVAEALVFAAQDYARAQGVARMDLTTARSNAQAQALYESLGWSRDDVFLAYSWAP